MIWKDIPNFEGYQVSDTGLVRTHNLELISLADNIRHGFDNGLYPSCKTVTLANKKTKEALSFRSMAQAEKYMGKGHGYLSNAVKHGRTGNAEYTWKIAQHMG